MSLVNYVPERGRVYVRRFDHEEARRRYAAGESVASLAAEYGVSSSGVYRVLNPETRRKDRVRNRAWRTGECEECGGPAMRLIGGKLQHNPDGRCLCLRCRSRLRRKQLVATESGPLLACGACGELKPLSEYEPRVRRKLAAGEAVGKSTCRACSTEARREYRDRHKVPCDRCGAPCLPPNEKGSNGAARALCLSCYRETVWPTVRALGVEASAYVRHERRRNGEAASPTASAE